MKNWRNLFLGLMAMTLFLVSCDDDESSVQSGTMSLQMSGLTQLGEGYVYGVWLKENATFTLLGNFNLTNNGILNKSLYSIDNQRLQSATGVLITIEAEDNVGTSPSTTHFLAGDFQNKGARLLTSHPDALNLDFSSSSASYILATPTDNDTTNEKSGLWFFDTMTMTSTLSLPVLPTNWIYESWLVTTTDSLISMGKFDNPLVADQSNPYGAGVNSGYAAPGDDFLQGRSDFPVDLREGQVYLSVEPIADDATTPFGIRPLSAEIVDSIPSMPLPLEYTESATARGIATR